MIKISKREDCCGCTACSCICGHNAIKMVADDLGFFYPLVNRNLCVECKLCEHICEFHQNYQLFNHLDVPIATVARINNEKDLLKSQSGGLFYSISKSVISQRGIVYGVGFNDKFKAIHKRVDTLDGLDELRGSKYVQSDLKDTFLKVKQDLREGKVVLFSGTACQTAGLNSFVGRKLRENLILVDIICHGVPSPFVWRDYLYYIQNKIGKKIYKVVFRDKKHYGWHSCKESFFHEDGFDSFDTYAYLFYQNIMLRPSCRVCYYANLNRPSDITIGDAWRGEQNNLPVNYDDNKGHSIVLCNTPKGKEIYDSLNDLEKFTVDINDYLQLNLKEPTKFNDNFAIFEEEYINKGFSYILKKYGNVGWRYRMKGKIHAIKYYYRIFANKLR